MCQLHQSAKARMILTDEECRQVWYDDSVEGSYIDKIRQIETAIVKKIGVPVGYYFRDDPCVFAMPGAGFSHTYPNDALDVVPLYKLPID